MQNRRVATICMAATAPVAIAAPSEAVSEPVRTAQGLVSGVAGRSGAVQVFKGYPLRRPVPGGSAQLMRLGPSVTPGPTLAQARDCLFDRLSVRLIR